MTPLGIESATCRFVAWCLNHYATGRVKTTILFPHHFSRLTTQNIYFLHIFLDILWQMVESCIIFSWKQFALFIILFLLLIITKLQDTHFTYYIYNQLFKTVTVFLRSTY
jgi:uncharacterized membrane protein YhdT